MTRQQLTALLERYVSDDDVELDKLAFLQIVADRIRDDCPGVRAMRKLWVTAATHHDGNVVFKGVGATDEAAREALLREVVAALSDDGSEPMTLEDAQSTIEEQLVLVEPFEIEVPG